MKLMLVAAIALVSCIPAVSAFERNEIADKICEKYIEAAFPEEYTDKLDMDKVLRMPTFYIDGPKGPSADESSCEKWCNRIGRDYGIQERGTFGCCCFSELPSGRRFKNEL